MVRLKKAQGLEMPPPSQLSYVVRIHPPTQFDSSNNSGIENDTGSGPYAVLVYDFSTLAAFLWNGLRRMHADGVFFPLIWDDMIWMEQTRAVNLRRKQYGIDRMTDCFI